MGTIRRENLFLVLMNSKNQYSQFDVFLISLDPTIGHEMKKTRPCVIVSPDEMNFVLKTVLIAPLTTKHHLYPTRVPLSFDKKISFAVLDQVKVVDKKRLIKNLGKLSDQESQNICNVFVDMFTQ